MRCRENPVVFYLYLKLEPLLDSSVLCIVLGSSASLKKAWYSTQFFQKDLHTSRLAMENSSVSLHEGPTLSCSLMRKCLRLKLSFRIFAQLNVLILVFPLRKRRKKIYADV